MVVCLLETLVLWDSISVFRFVKEWLSVIIAHTHYLFISDWPNAYSEFSKSTPVTSSSCRLYNNHVKDTQGYGQSCHA